MIVSDIESLSQIFNIHRIIEFGGLLIILAIIYVETGFLLGIIAPGGDYMLFSAGIFCGSQYLDIPIYWLVILLILASYLGDITGYFKAWWLGGKLFTNNKSRFFKPEYLERANKFYKQYGIFAFIVGRFIPIIRTLIPMIAGASRFSSRKFILFDLLGAFIWVGTLVPLGYYLGKTYPEVINYSIYILLLIIVVASIPFIRIMFSKMKKS